VGMGFEALRYGRRQRETRVGKMRRLQMLVGIASVGLVAASLVMAAPASARNVFEGTDGNDNIAGTAADDTIYGKGGIDHLWGLGRSDSVFGGDGPDGVFGGDGPDSVFGGKGDDGVFGGDGNDDLHDGNGADGLFGNDGDDTITLVDDESRDAVHCGAGSDTVNFEGGKDKEDNVAGDCENT
jgi:Ca2+-binding RTX toxin-like protein